MTRKTIKTIGLCIALFFSALFINNSDVKAIGTPDGNGSAECHYYFKTTSYKNQDDRKNYIIAVAVFRNTEGNYDGYAKTACSGLWETEIVDEKACKIANYNNVFNLEQSSTLKNKFRGGNDSGAWRCPDLYYSVQNGNSVTIAFEKKSNKYQKADLRDSIINQTPALSDGDLDGKRENEGVIKDSTDESDNISNIINWGNNSKSDGESSYENYCDLIPNSIWSDVRIVLWIINIAGILLLIAMSAIEFIKAITSSEEDKIKKAFKNTIFRIVACIVLLLAPMVITFIVNFVNSNNVQVDGSGAPVIGADGDPLCKIDQ